jgi:hypothetical protein
MSFGYHDESKGRLQVNFRTLAGTSAEPYVELPVEVEGGATCPPQIINIQDTGFGFNYRFLSKMA